MATYIVEYIGHNCVMQDRIDADKVKTDRKNNLIFLKKDNGEKEVAGYHERHWKKWRMSED